MFDAKFVAIAAISASPFEIFATTSLGSATIEILYLPTVSPLSALSLRLAAPIPVGPDKTSTFVLAYSIEGAGVLDTSLAGVSVQAQNETAKASVNSKLIIFFI